MLEAFLASDLIDGWIYVTGHDGKLYPELVTGVRFDDGSDHRGRSTPSVRLFTTAYTKNENKDRQALTVVKKTHYFAPQNAARRRLPDIFADAGMYKETPELKQEYLASMTRYQETTLNAFASQFRFTGPAFHYEARHYERRGQVQENRRVIHDLQPEEFGAFSNHVESMLFPDGVGQVPEHPLVRVFDLKSHESYWVHGDYLKPYKYDKSLSQKLVLPKTHRDLLDVLTTNLNAFTGDIIEGKTAGNVVLCKGIPGVGKTLTAEVYAELIERPLYAIHSGSLGTRAEAVQANLQNIFIQAKRWGCVLLLDEADVFVTQRGNNVEQNAIVAEFLRALEYFDGLMFMTTNRPDDIDDAFISRCAAIIQYDAPSDSAAAAIWRVMADQYDTSLDAALVNELVYLFPGIAPRDIKMLFRLALRFSLAQQAPLDIETFRRCAMFRAITMRQDEAAPTDSSARLSEVNLRDLTVYTYREPGNEGGFSMDEKGVAVLHRPTGIEVRSHTERSQHANRQKCIDDLAVILRNRGMSH